MKDVTFTSRKSLSRRHLLRSAGACLGLPVLDAMTPAFGATPRPPKRFFGFTLALGLHAPNFLPKGDGRDYQPSRYLQPLQRHREDFTVVSGTSLPGVGGGHRSEPFVLTGHPNAGGSGSKNSISLDQRLAGELGGETRFPSLTLSTWGELSPSHTENGAMIPGITSPDQIFAELFLEETEAKKQQRMQAIREGRSILDLVAKESKALEKRLGPGDRDKLDCLFTSLREVENRFASNETWIGKPKPKVGMELPAPIKNRSDTLAIQLTMQQIVHLAFETDSTRFIVLHSGLGSGVIPREGIDQSYHNLSHHGLDEEKIEQLTLIEETHMEDLAKFFDGMKSVDEGGSNLLDNTTVLVTSNLGNASSHDTRNLPTILAGGGFEHGRHLAFDPNDNYPLSNLYLSILNQFGLADKSFATSTGTMLGI